MHSICAYGLKISSEFPFVEQEVETGSSDVVILKGHVDDLPPEARDGGNWFRASPQETCLVWEGVGVLLIRDGRQIIVDPDPDVEKGLLHQAIQSTALGILLHQRGLFPLHAGSMSIRGRAVAFAGESGSGKSTLASALHARGNDFVSDDITAIKLDGPHPLVLPGIPRIRLWPDTMESFRVKAETCPRLHPGSEKRQCPVSTGFVQSPQPLTRIYILAEGTSDMVESLPGHEALLELIRYCFCSELIRASIGPQRQMEMAAQLVRNVDIYRLTIRHSLNSISDLARLIEEHIE